MDWDQEGRVLRALHELAEALHAQNRVLEQILERLPKPATYHATVGGTITVRN